MPHEINRDPTSPDARSTLDGIKRLQADRAHRDYHSTFFVEGVRNVVRAIENRFDVKTLVYTEKLLVVPIARQMIRQLRRSGTPTLPLSPETFRQISTARHASGVGAIVAQRWSRLHATSPSAGLCWVVLQDVRSQGNFGTLIRTSEAVGGAGFVLVGGGIDPYDPDVVRASMGALFRQTFIRTTDLSLRNWLRRHRCRVVGASPDGSAELHHFQYPRPTILVLGEERSGLSPFLRDLCADLVRIPMAGAADSLNLAVAGSLLLYEVYRTRSINSLAPQRERQRPP